MVCHRLSTPIGYYLASSRHSIFDCILSREFASLEGIRFIQIGANDGELEDPLVSYIARFGWQGTMYEPLPQFCDVLRRKYADNPAVRVVNAAIHREGGDRDMFYISPADKEIPGFVAGLGTFDHARIVAAAKRLGLDEREVSKRRVATVNWPSVLAAYGDQQCDVLAIDTEGYDYEILKMIDFKLFRPKVVHFEHSHLTLDDRMAAYKLLLAASYEIATWSGDSTAWRTS